MPKKVNKKKRTYKKKKGGGHKEDVVKQLQKLIGEKALAEQIFDDASNLEAKELKEAMDNVYQKHSFKKVIGLLNVLLIVLENNADLKYNNFRSNMIRVLKDIKTIDYTELEEYKELFNKYKTLEKHNREVEREYERLKEYAEDEGLNC